MRAAASALLALLAGAPAGAEEADLRSLRIGMPADQLPAEGYAGFSCADGTAVQGWQDYRRCPADAAGLKRGDVVTAVDGAPADDPDAFGYRLATKSLGGTAGLTVRRGNQTLALALKPKVLLMDEPTSGVASADKFGVMETLMNALREAHVSSVFVEHDMEMVKLYATRVAVWAQGIIQMTGEPEVVLNDPDVIRNVIGS